MEQNRDTSRGRLTPIDRARELLPWRRAEELDRCALYWVPVKAFPVPDAQRAWLNVFFDKLAVVLTENGGLRSEIFLGIHAIGESKKVEQDFHRTLLRFNPLVGLSRRPGEKIKSLPDIEELQQNAKDFISGKKKPPTMRELMPDYCYWFVLKHPKEQRELFLGYGGLTMLFMKPDPDTVPPEDATLPDVYFEKIAPTVKKEDFEAMVAGTFALRDKFLAKSKELFGAGLEDEPQYPGIVYIVPLLRSSHFFQESDEVVASWFELFDVYVNESLDDEGILLAAKSEMDDTIIEILREMKDENLNYPVV